MIKKPKKTIAGLEKELAAANEKLRLAERPRTKTALEKEVEDLKADNTQYREQNRRMETQLEVMRQRLKGATIGSFPESWHPDYYSVLGQKIKTEEVDLPAMSRKIADKLLTGRNETLTEQEKQYIIGGRVDELIVERLTQAAETLEENAFGFFQRLGTGSGVEAKVQRGMDLAQGHNDIFRARCMRAVIEWMSKNGRMYIRRM